MTKGSMRLLRNWIVENYSRLRDLAWLVGTVGVALALLIYVFGTASHPVRVPIRNWATHRSENSKGPASFAALVAKIEPAIISVKVERIESVKMKGKAPGDNALRLLPISLAHKAGQDKIIDI